MKYLAVSVALCTFNGERFLRQQMDSILNQSRRPDQIVVSDDCSTDNTIEILRSYEDICPCEIIVSQNEENLGVTKNFQKCIGMCGGDIIFLSDQDDFWRSDKIEKELEAFENEEIGLVFTNAHVVDENGSLFRHKLWDAARCSGKIVDEITGGNAFKIFLRKNFATGGTMAFRRKCFEGIAIPDGWVHDHFIALTVSAGYKIYPLNECLSYYRQHNSQQIGGARDRFFKKVLLRLTTKRNVHRKYSAKVDSALAAYENSEMLDESQISALKEFGEHMANRTEFIALPFHRRLFKIIFGLKYYLRYVDGLYDAVSDILKV